jgi:hypothetical protein
MKTEESFEQSLLQELRHGNIAKEQLNDLVGIAAGIHKGGLRRIKVFPVGIPVVDGVRVTGVLEAGEMNKFFENILTKTPRLGRVTVFPHGIPWPDVFTVQVDVGATAQGGVIVHG